MARAQMATMSPREAEQLERASGRAALRFVQRLT
jgi:hypothetical protein